MKPKFLTHILAIILVPFATESTPFGQYGRGLEVNRLKSQFEFRPGDFVCGNPLAKGVRPMETSQIRAKRGEYTREQGQNYRQNVS